MAIGIAQFTIKDLNDITTASTAPVSPTVSQLWVDTSVTPNLLKKWNGSTWAVVNDYSSDIQNVKTTTTTNTTSINTIQGQITTLISNTTVTKDGTTTQLKDAYNGTVATVNSILTTIGQHTSQIDTANSNIASVTSKEAALEVTVNSINASLTSTNSTVSTHTTQIATTNANIATINTNVSNVTSRVSSLEVTTNSITTRVSATETTLSNLQIGGRNLIQNSNSCDWFVPCNYSSANWVGTTIDAIGETGITKKVRRAYRTTGSGDFRINTSVNTGLIASRTFTFSVWIKSNISNTNLNVNFILGGTTSDENMTSGVTLTIYPDKWVKYTYTKTYASTVTSNSIRVYMNCGTNPCDILLSDAKLEEGNQTTDWTPAPEDVDQSILDVKTYATTTINSNVSTINQTTDSIKANVSSLQSSVSTINTTLGNKADTTTVTAISNRTATLETSVTGINASITTLNSTTTSNTSAISTANSQITTINSSVSSLQSSVSVLQNKIALKVEQTNIDTAVATLDGKITSTNSTVSSLQTSINLQLGSITSSVSTKIGSVNLVKNSSFEDSNAFSVTITAGTPTSWGIADYATIAASVGFGDSALSKNIFNIQKMSGAIASTDVYAYTNIYVDVMPGKTYTISYYHAERGTISSFSSYIQTFDSNGNSTGHVGINPITMSGTTWGRYSTSWTCPTGVYKIQFRFGFICTNSAWMLIDNIQVEEGSTLTNWATSAVDVVGTMVTQSPTSVMTAFNGISSYFQVSADGAKFGNIASGAYTKMSQNGLEHVDSTGAVPYFYISYTGESYVDVAAGTYNKTVTIAFPADLITKLNGKVPKAIASLEKAYPNGDTFAGGVRVSAITSTNITIDSTCFSNQLYSGGNLVYSAYKGGSVFFSYLIIG
jgi:hypothetical protein